MKRKPFWLRLKQRYYNWRQRTLGSLHICMDCGWRPSRGEYICPHCYDEKYYEYEA